jgi:hypothetical protein
MRINGLVVISGFEVLGIRVQVSLDVQSLAFGREEILQPRVLLETKQPFGSLAQVLS